MSSSSPGFLRRVSSRFSQTVDESDALDLRVQTQQRGCTSIAELADRQAAVVSGDVRSIIVRPRGDVPALVAELYDGSMPLNLVWLGRHEIVGIKPGVTLRARGRVTRSRGVLTMFNPLYEIVPQPQTGHSA